MIEPRVRSVPGCGSSLGREAVELAASVGLMLDPWQAFVLEHSLGVTEQGRWAAFEVGVCIPRQNGKGAILEARALAGLFLLGERLIIHSAHEWSTADEAFRRLLGLIEGSSDLSRRVAKAPRAHGSEGIDLRNGQRIRFRTRTKGGARGFTGDCLILDEAMILPEEVHSALLPILSAKSITGNPQVWYTGSAVDQRVHEHGEVFARVRRRALAGDDPGLAYFEWSVDADGPDALAPEVAEDRVAWAQANPGLGIRISEQHVNLERLALTPRGFAVERLGAGDWPTGDGDGSIIAVQKWLDLHDPRSKALDPVSLAFDVAPDRSFASIAAAGARQDGHHHLELIDHRRGTGWVVERVLELVERHQPANVIYDGAGPAASLAPALEEAGLELLPLSAREQSQACGMIFDAADESTIRVVPASPLTLAVRGAQRRPLGDAWAWSRRASMVDISPLVAVTMALWGFRTFQEEPAPAPVRAISLADL